MVDGQVLHFRLVGVNNQNFLMEDIETGSWWQQVTGEAISGPLRGKRLELVPWDEVSFALWRGEHPGSLILERDPTYDGPYAPADWEERADQMPAPPIFDSGAPLPPRELVVGLEIDGLAKAYPITELAAQSPVVDRLGEVPILLVVAADGKSVRAFDRRMGGEPLDFFRKPDAEELLLVDAQTGSTWDFSGRAIDGPRVGEELTRVQVLKDFFFDWLHYHPETRIYRGGLAVPRDLR